LLDVKKDAKEIADLKAKVKHLESLPRAVTPIAIALNPNTPIADMVDETSAVFFDLDGSGRKKAWTWITPKAAWLVYDLAGTGKIGSGIQMFGNRTFMLFLEDGYAALRLLDEDGDGVLRGRELKYLALWQDTNSDGVSERDEVRSVDEHDIVSIKVKAFRGADGLLHEPQGVRKADGSFRASADLILKSADFHRQTK